MFTYKSTNNGNLFTISWYKDTELLCTTKVKINGNSDGINKAIAQTAQNLRKNNPTLFNVTVINTMEELN